MPTEPTRKKDRRQFSEYESLMIVLGENPALKQRVMHKLRQLKTAITTRRNKVKEGSKPSEDR